MILLASIIRSLDRHQGAATVLLTAVLIAVTMYYAVQNTRMVDEMRRARRLSVLPRLAIEFHFVGPTTTTVAIKNVGPGAALDIDVRLIYDAVDPDRESPERRWRRNVLLTGEQFEFMPPGEGIGGNINTLPATYKAIRLIGSMTDATHTRHLVDETFDDLAEWREFLHDAGQRWVTPDRERRLAEEIGKQIETPIRSLSTSVDRIANAMVALRPKDEPDPD